MKLRHSKLVLLACLLLLPLQACTAVQTKGLPTEGSVIEEGTNKPIPDVIVVAHWLGTVSGFGGHGGTSCRHVETATTDDQGRYRLALWEDRGPTVVYTYKEGYQASEGRGNIRTYERVLDILKPFTGTTTARLRYLQHLEQIHRTCRIPDANEKALLPFYRGIYNEGTGIAREPDALKIIDGFLTGIEIIELGYNEGLRRSLERNEKRKQP